MCLLVATLAVCSGYDVACQMINAGDCFFHTKTYLLGGGGWFINNVFNSKLATAACYGIPENLYNIYKLDTAYKDGTLAPFTSKLT